jgi:hypothetical protein
MAEVPNGYAVGCIIRVNTGLGSVFIKEADWDGHRGSMHYFGVEG